MKLDQEISKSVKLPARMWQEIKTVIDREDSDFSKLCRKALRAHLDTIPANRKRKAA